QIEDSRPLWPRQFNPSGSVEIGKLGWVVIRVGSFGLFGRIGPRNSVQIPMRSDAHQPVRKSLDSKLLAGSNFLRAFSFIRTPSVRATVNMLLPLSRVHSW